MGQSSEAGVAQVVYDNAIFYHAIMA